MSQEETNVGAYFNNQKPSVDKRCSKTDERNRYYGTNTEKDWENLQNNFSEQKATKSKNREVICFGCSGNEGCCIVNEGKCCVIY